MHKIISLIFLSIFFIAVDANRAKAENNEVMLITENLRLMIDEALIKQTNNIIPNKDNPTIENLGNGVLKISYIEFDRKNVSINVQPSSDTKGKYIAKISYNEFLYVGEYKEGTDISKTFFGIEHIRKITELATYVNGKWIY